MKLVNMILRLISDIRSERNLKRYGLAEDKDKREARRKVRSVTPVSNHSATA